MCLTKILQGRTRNQQHSSNNRGRPVSGVPDKENIGLRLSTSLRKGSQRPTQSSSSRDLIFTPLVSHGGQNRDGERLEY